MNAFAPLAVLRIAEADAAMRARLDRFVAGHERATPFHRGAWTRAVERGCRQRGTILVAERSGALIGMLPLTIMRSPLFGSALVSSGFGVGGGILAEDEEAIDQLAAAAVDLARREKCGSVELRGGRLPADWASRGDLYAGFVRPLAADAEAILKAIPRKQRAEVRRAQGNGLAVKVGRGADDLRTHYQVYAESVRNLGTPVFPRALFAAMLEGFGEDADILTVSHENTPVASVFSLYDKGCVYPYWGGGTQAARGLRANELLYFELMRHAAARGCTRFDFGRSKVGTGAFHYKKNWGFEPTPLTYAARSLDGAPVREINPLSPRYRLQVGAWRRLPLWLANRLGPPIARGLG